MQINTITEDNFTDIFAEVENQKQTSFSSNLKDEDIFNIPVAPEKKEDGEEKTEETKEIKDSDIFSKTKEGEDAPKEDLLNAIEFSKKLIELGEFQPIVDDTTNEPIELKTFEDIKDLWLVNKTYEKEQVLKTAEEQILASKSPIWKLVLDYADKLEDPTEILPFLQGVENLKTVVELNTENPEDAESIYRVYLKKNNTPLDLIDEQVELIKANNKLTEYAEKVKPILIKAEEEYLESEKNKADLKRQNDLELLNFNHQKTIESLESPFLEGVNLTQEEKAKVYNLLATPSKEGGYEIYHKIDKLYEEGNFDKLKKLALLLENEDSYHKYVSTADLSKSAETLQRKIRISTELKTSSKETNPEEVKVIPKGLRKPGMPSTFGRYS